MVSPATADDQTALVFAVRLPGGEGAWLSDWDAVDAAFREKEGPVWVHLDRMQPEVRTWLTERAKVDPVALDAMLLEHTRPGVRVIGDGLLVNLRGVNMNPGADPDELISVRIWVEPNRIITLRQFRFQTIRDLRGRAESGQAPKTTGGVLAEIALGLATRLSDSATNLETLVDEVEDGMLERDDDDLAARSSLAIVRRQSIAYRRFLAPQREALSELTHGPHQDRFSEQDRSRFRLGLDHVTRVLEALDEARDRAAVTQDELRARHEARLGRTLYVLTIIATVALPLSLLTGLLGINVGGIPLAESSWGFGIVCVSMVVIGVAEVVVMRALRWL